MAYRIPYVNGRLNACVESRLNKARASWATHVNGIHERATYCPHAAIEKARFWRVAPQGDIRQHRWEMHHVLKIMCEEI